MVFKLNDIRKSADHYSQNTLKDGRGKRNFLLSNWHRWIAYITAVWSFFYGSLGLYWALGGAGFPFGENDSRGFMMGSFLANIRSDVGGVTIAYIGGIGAIAALATIRIWGEMIPRAVLLIFAWIMSITLVFVIPDVRVLQNFAYSFMLHFQLIDWPVINQLLCMVGGFLWGATALAYQRRSREACVNCGRQKGTQNTSIAGNSLGKYATYIAIVMALPYGIVRLAWAAEIPLGVSDAAATLISNQSFTERLIEAVLGGLPICGAILTLGLIQKWGEKFPRWFLYLAGKRVPIWFAVIPATCASVLITLAGLKISPIIILKILDGSINTGNWGELGPSLFWLPWGVALGLATIAYYQRRRGQCKYCRRF
ncbi:hypothetical protein BW425_21655 [Bacillus pseudomycoides]|uniref:Uncharacterized protein n=1 Tax=Bacillus pseudomycoides TaxID=64104 RepID=A0A1Y3M9P3_9BACI|nr:hypothetical protein [Bacillus pseudomycoides]OUM46816.1 hypothetical protein BW425_21655 [Bacillus pseudomycoides]